MGNFISTITGLLNNTVYYIRAYATNSVGTSYGEEISVVLWLNEPGPQVNDIEGNAYNSVKIGNQIWITTNLKATKYSNGDLIGTTTTDITNESTPRYQWAYGNNESNVDTYGRLYTWYTATDSRNVCPSGWHVPSDPEWTILTDFLDGRNSAGGKLKEAGITHWRLPNTGATNETGFTALPGGYRYSTGIFADIGEYGFWWSSTASSSFNAWDLHTGWSGGGMGSNEYNKTIGYSIRCLKNN
jgi:uncharacterized protein (TIGR02145 family)